MKLRHVVRRAVLVAALLIVAVVAGGTLRGALQQFPRAHTLGQRVETAIQLVCSFSSVLVVVTCFWKRPWAHAARVGWAGSLAITAGLSALVWGPPMPGVALVFAAATLLVALGLTRALRWAQAV